MIDVWNRKGCRNKEEGCKIWFPNKKDRIVQHFKKCPNFLAKTIEKERENVFAILQPSNDIIPQKRSSKISFKIFKNLIYIIYLVFYSNK